MNNKNTITMTTLSVIAVLAIASIVAFEIQETEAVNPAAQPSKLVFVENISVTAEFAFRDGTEVLPIQLFTQTAGFGQKSLVSVDDPKADSGKSGRANPAFTMEKIIGGSPYLYAAADQTQQYSTNSGFEYPYKFFNVNVVVAQGGDILRSFEYRDCQVTNYAVNTRTDNEEGYTGKGIALVDQFSFECKGYTPLNPAMEKMNHKEKAKTTSSTDLKRTDKWEENFMANKP